MAVRVPGTIVPYNENYPAVNAEHVGMPDGTRLDKALPVPLTQEAYDALKEAGALENRIYFIVEEDST